MTNEMTKEELLQKMFQEATWRLRLLRFEGSVPRDFQKSHTVYYSERGQIGKNAYGILYWVKNHPEWLEKIREIEQKRNILIYHAIHTYTAFGECLDLLYVAAYPEGWEADRKNITGPMCSYGYEVNAYTWNITQDFVEFGRIGIRERGGGLIRTM